jgi:hypothetical protein
MFMAIGAFCVLLFLKELQYTQNLSSIDNPVPPSRLYIEKYEEFEIFPYRRSNCVVESDYGIQEITLGPICTSNPDNFRFLDIENNEWAIKDHIAECSSVYLEFPDSYRSPVAFSPELPIPDYDYFIAICQREEPNPVIVNPIVNIFRDRSNKTSPVPDTALSVLVISLGGLSRYE